jgi:hypothetical protein
LPSSRDLAEELAVSRGVVVDSYSQLAAEGYLSARRGSGTSVASLPESAGPPVRRQLSPRARFRYDLRPGQADFHAFPRDRWKAALDRALRQLPAMRLTYADHRGVPELRNAVAEHKTRRGPGSPASACTNCTVTARYKRRPRLRFCSATRVSRRQTSQQPRCCSPTPSTAASGIRRNWTARADHPSRLDTRPIPDLARRQPPDPPSAAGPKPQSP